MPLGRYKFYLTLKAEAFCTEYINTNKNETKEIITSALSKFTVRHSLIIGVGNRISYAFNHTVPCKTKSNTRQLSHQLSKFVEVIIIIHFHCLI